MREHVLWLGGSSADRCRKIKGKAAGVEPEFACANHTNHINRFVWFCKFAIPTSLRRPLRHDRRMTGYKLLDTLIADWSSILMPRLANPDVQSRLCSAGGELIHRTSFGSTGVQEIASAARVPKGSFYSYFESKDAYAAEILNDYWRMIDESFGDILRDESVPPLQAVSNFFAALVEYHADQQFIPGCLVGNLALELASTSNLVRGKLRHLFGQWTAELTGRLTEARLTEALPLDAEPVEVAACLIDAFEGAVLRAKVDQGRAALKRFQDFVLPRLLG